MKNNPKVSIIVPVYNAEKYLSNCIDSILSQTFDDFELILIDDGSRDESGKICDEYAKRDSRIHVFHKDNGGVSSARNYGLEYSKGEWICFVDADDILKPEFLANLIVYCNYDQIVGGNIIFGDISEERGVQKEVIISLKSHDAAILDYGTDLRSGGFFGYPWGKLYKASIINENHIKFETSVFLCEDLCFVLNYLSYCRTIIIIPYNNYLYRYENQVNKYMMDSASYLTHYNAFIASLSRFTLLTGYSFPNMKRTILQIYFYRFLEYLKKCSYKDYLVQSAKFRTNCSRQFENVIAYEHLFKRIYIRILILCPFIGYCVFRILKVLNK